MTRPTPTPAPGRKHRKLTPRERIEAKRFWEHGEKTLEELAKRYGVTPDALRKWFASHGIKRGSKTKEVEDRVNARLEQKSVDEVNETVERTRASKDEAYKITATIRKLIGRTLIAAINEGRSASTTYADMKALKVAAEALQRSNDEAWRVLGIKPEDVDQDTLPDLRITELTRDEIQARQRELESTAAEEDGQLDLPDVDLDAALDDDDDEDDELETDDGTPPQTPAEAAAELEDVISQLEQAGAAVGPAKGSV